MKNYINSGEKIVFTAPSGGVTGGSGYVLNDIFGIVEGDALENEDAVLITRGVFEVPKEGAGSGQAWAPGDNLYWDASESRLTTTATSNTLVGVAAAAAITTATVGELRLNS